MNDYDSYTNFRTSLITMKILLIQNVPYIPTVTGSNKCNRLLVEELAERKHICRVVTPATNIQESKDERCAKFLEELMAQGIQVTSFSATAYVFHHHGVEVHAVINSSRLRNYLIDQIYEFQPTWTIVSSEDPGQGLLETAL